ncbi:hypothetical protein HMPREF1870_00489 [Bacteroidales bacterium KA00344]|nr:hypothetical protein HMPREF1870_00489 [Bacteroidales bacterium KA00344]
MESSNNNMTAERSLEIISRTIEESRQRITRGSWKSMLIWGVAVAIIALIVGHLWKNTSAGPGANGLWGALGLLALAEQRYEKRHPKIPQTFVSKTISQIWGSLGIMAGSIGLFMGMLALLQVSIPLPVMPAPNSPESFGHIPITALVILLMGIAGMITGRILKSTAITVCCYIAGILGSFLALVYAGPYEMVVLAGVAVVGLIVPALIIKTKEA